MIKLEQQQHQQTEASSTPTMAFTSCVNTRSRWLPWTLTQPEPESTGQQASLLLEELEELKFLPIHGKGKGRKEKHLFSYD